MKYPIRRSKKALPLIFTAALILSMGGCAVKKVPPVRTYTLTVQTPGIRNIALPSPLIRNLRVEMAARGRLAGTRNLYYLDDHYRLQTYAYHRWYDTFATMLENKLLVAFKEANVARNVFDTAMHPTQANLRVEVVEAYIDVSDPDQPEARLRLLVTLQYEKGETKTKIFEERVAAKSLSPEAGIQAFNEAANEATVEIVKWLANS